VTGRPVRDELGRRLPATLRLTVAALALSLTMAMALACAAASAPGRVPDTAARLFALAGLVLPGFLVALALLHFVVLRLGWFQVVADGTWSTVLLPAFALSLSAAALWSRVLRAGLIQARGAAHIEVCKARGASPLRLLIIHDLPNALVPFLTVVGTGFAALLGGAPIVETVFTWPGVGRFAVQAINARDLPVVQGFTLLAILAFVVVSMLVDVIAVAVDRRLAPPQARRRPRALPPELPAGLSA
ncbi:MAG: ABC transporter permease, partial [Acidimicrobiales bacterium]